MCITNLSVKQCINEQDRCPGPSMGVMMDPKPLYPKQYHPVVIDKTRDLSGRAHHVTRTSRPTRYFLTDFSNAKQFQPEADRAAGKIPGSPAEREPPELRYSTSGETIDPFPEDVYYLGAMFREWMKVSLHKIVDKRHGY